MIGGLIKVAAQMAAWGATASATAGAAKWASSRFRRVANIYAKHGSESSTTKTRFTRAFLTAVTGKSDPARQVNNLKDVKSFARRRIRSSYAGMLQKFSKPSRQNIQFLRRSVRDEMLVMPMNYTMYRIEKHRAVTPEDRDATSSFLKYYMGAPMAISVASGAIIDKMRYGKPIRTATSRIAKKLGATRRKRYGKVVMGAIGGAKVIANKMAAMQRARFSATEGRSILSLLGTASPMVIASNIWRRYRDESIQVAGGGINNMVSRILKDHDTLVETYAQRAKRLAVSDSKVRAKAFEDKAVEQVTKQTRERLAAYKKKATVGNKFTTFINKIQKDLNDPSLAIRPEVTAIPKSMSSVFAGTTVPTGRYIMGEGAGTVIDFGRLSLTNIRDAAISGTTKGLSGWFLHLFGARDLLKAKHSEHSLIGAVTVTKREPLNLPMAYFDESGESTPEDIMGHMMGIDYKNATEKGKETVKDFLGTRLRLYKEEYGITKVGEQREAFTRSARHGELWMKGGDMITQMPGGRTSITTQHYKEVKGTGDGKRFLMPLTIDIGGWGGKMLSFTKFTRESGNIPSRLIRSHTGYEEFTYKTNRGPVTAVHGPGKYGKIIDAFRSEDQQGLWYKFKQTLDLGYSESRSFFSKIASVFRKHTDPRYPTTFFSNDYISSPEFRKEILKTGRSKEDMLGFFRDESDKMMLEYWYGSMKRAGGTDNLIKMFKEFGRRSGDEHIMTVADPLISPNMSTGQAQEKVDSLIDQIRAIGKEYASGDDQIYKHFLWRDLEDIQEVRRLVTVGGDKTVLDVMGNISSRRGTIYGMRPARPNKLDEYNALALRIQSGILQSGELGGVRPSEMRNTFRKFGAFSDRVITDKQRSAWYASSHMARTYHGLASLVSDTAVKAGDTIQHAEGAIDNILASIGHVDSLAFKDITKFYKTRTRFAPWSMWGYDHRMKWGDTQNVKTGIYLLPEASNFGLVSKEPFKLDGQTVQIAKGVMDASNISVMSMFHAFNRTASEIMGIGFDETNLSTPFQYFSKMLMQRVVPFTAMYMGYSVLDRLSDKYLDGTPFGEGLTTFGANTIAGARVGAQGFLDTIGVGGLSSYMEDLMPGFITSPLSGIMRGMGPTAMGMTLGMKSLGPRGALTGGIVGSAVGMLVGGAPLGVFGMWDISKNRNELVQELLGKQEVAVRKGRWWELSGSPFEGTRVQYYRPHIYPLLRSDYKETPGFKDSLFTEIVGNMYPDLYAMKNYYSRPYPVTSGLFSNLPVFSNMIDLLTSASSTARFATGRGIAMHEEEFSPTYMQRLGEEAGLSPQTVARQFLDREGFFSATEGSAGTSPMGTLANAYMREDPVHPGDAYNYTEVPMMRSSFNYGLGETVENVKDIVGLRGFIMGSAFESMTGRKGLYDYAPELAAPVDIPGVQREYWDYELGGILGVSEILRRYVPHRRRQIQTFNPIRNAMPDWLPGHNYYVDLLHGDPYCISPDTLVEVNDLEFKHASDVCIGTKVTSHVGTLVPITASKIRHITSNEHVFRLKVVSLSGVKSRYSETHPILVSTDRGRTNIWKEVRDVEIGDYVAYPIPKVIEKDTTIDLADFTDYPCSKTYLYYSGQAKTPFPEIYEYLEKRGNHKGFNRGERKRLLDERGWTETEFESAQSMFTIRKIPERCNRFVKITKQVGYLIGLYIAEGWCYHGGSGFALHKSENHLFDMAVSGARDIVQDCTVTFTPSKNHNGAEGHIRSNVISLMLEKLCGKGSHNKHLPLTTLRLPKDIVGSILRGYFDGDGCTYNSSSESYGDKGKYHISAKSTSLILLLQIRKVLLRFGIVGNIMQASTNGQTFKVGKYIGISGESWNILFRGVTAGQLANIIGYNPPKMNHTKSTWSFTTDKYVYMRVLEKEKVDDIPEVVGFQAGADKSFCVAGIATHNTAIPMGEARLPGPAYETLHDVDLTMPIVSEILGEAEDSQMAYFLGLPEYMSARNKEMDIAKVVAISYIEDAKRYGELVKEQSVAYNVTHDIAATVNAVIKTAKGDSVPVSIVPRGFGGESNLNAYLILSDIETGILMEVNTKTGGITEKMVRKDVKRFAKEITRASKARAKAYGEIAPLEAQGKAMNLANSYSWFDRFRILADVAHYSDEYRVARNIIKRQITAGVFPAERVAEFRMIEEQVENKKKAYSFNEYRFKDLGEGLTPYTKARDRAVKSQYNTLERVVGEGWERLTHTRNPLQVKFYHNMDALEEYERNAIYGKSIKMWENPVEDWLKSYAYRAMGEDSPAQGALSWATAGFLVGGTPLAGVAAGMGAAVSGINWLTDHTFIPDRVLAARDITAQGDAVKYVKYRRLYDETGNPEFLRKAQATVTGTAEQGGVLQANRAGFAMGQPERNYIEDIINNVTTSNIDRVSKILPEPAVASVYDTIGLTNEAQGMMRNYADKQAYRHLPGLDSSIYSKNVPMDAPIITTFEQEGLNCFTAEQEIITYIQPKRVSDITTEDIILDGSGKFKKPIQVYKSHYSGKILRIEFTRIPFEMTVTPEHQIEIGRRVTKFVRWENGKNIVRPEWKYTEQSIKKVLNTGRYRLKLTSLPLPESISHFDKIPLSKDLATVLGWMLAEGSYQKRNGKFRGIHLGLNIKEMEYAKEIKHCIETVFSINANIHIYKSSTSGNPYISITAFSMLTTPVIRELIGEYSDAKIINPELLKAPIDFLQRMIHCWFLGDGWITHSEICVHTNSKTLAVQGWHILRSIGIEACLQYVKSRGKKKEGWRVRISRSKYEDTFYNTWKRTPYTTLNIKKVTEENYDGNVYDIEMPDNHYYTTLTGTVHNSHDAGYGWYSQMAQIERLKAMGIFNGESLYGDFDSKVSTRDFAPTLSDEQSLRRVLSKLGTNVEIMDDGQDRIVVEIISRGL